MFSIIQSKYKNIYQNKFQKYYFLFQILITVIMCYLFYKLLKNLDFSIINILEIRNKLLLVICLAVLMFLFRSIRLYFLFDKNISILSSILITLKSYTVNNIFPFRLGEFYRIIVVKREIEITYKKAAFFLISERIIDVIFLVTIMLIPLCIIFYENLILKKIYFSMTVVTLLVISFLISFRKSINIFLIKKFKEFYKILLLFIPIIPKILIVSLIIYTLEIYVYYKTSAILGIEMPFMYLLYIIGASNLLPIFLPTPGGVGSFEYVVVAILTYNLSFGQVEAINYAFIVHFILIVPITTLGICIFMFGFLTKR